MWEYETIIPNCIIIGSENQLPWRAEDLEIGLDRSNGVGKKLVQSNAIEIDNDMLLIVEQGFLKVESNPQFLLADISMMH